MRLFFYILLILLVLQGCGLKEREQKIRKKEQEITQRQSELQIKEQQLAIKEKELNDRELELDSTRMYIDSTKIYDPVIIGKWSINMKCTETTCEGSAIGDVKTEQWEIDYDKDNSVIAKVYVGNKLTRIYSGYYKISGLHLMYDNSIFIDIAIVGKDKMEGTREIAQTGCKIIYSVSAEKNIVGK